MNSSLLRHPHALQKRDVEHLPRELRALIESCHAPSTRRAYAADLQCWSAWCEARQVEPQQAAPLELARYVTDLVTTGPIWTGCRHQQPLCETSPCVRVRPLRTTTLRRRLAAIKGLYRWLGKEPNPASDPLVLAALEGLDRTCGSPPHQAAPLYPAALRDYLARHGRTGVLGARERVVLTLGWCLGARRSELRALAWGDVRLTREGVDVLVRRSKADQRAEGRRVVAPRSHAQLVCPVRALESWRACLELVFPGDLGADRPVLRALQHGHPSRRPMSAEKIDDVVRRVGHKLGLEGVSAHSLRSGLATTAARRGVPIDAIARQLGCTHETAARYVRAGDRWEHCAAAGLLDC